LSAYIVGAPRHARTLAKTENGPVNLIRILAALLVALGHARILFLVDYDDAPHNAIQAGLYGISAIGHQAVVVFFVLSGFWVGGSASNTIRTGAFHWKSYITARAVRLWVVMIPALVLTAVLDFLGRSWFGNMSAYAGDPAYGGVAMDQRPLDLLTFLGNTFFMGGIRVETLGSNTALWSLGYEFWMYILAPMLMLLPFVSWRRRALLLAVFVVLGALVGFPVLVYLPIWLLGVAVSAYKHRLDAIADRMDPRLLTLVRLGAGLLTIGAAMAVRGLNSLPAWVGDYVVAIPTALLLASLTTGFIKPSTEGSLVGTFARLANSSYSLYAIHIPILVMLACVLGVQVGNRWPSDLLHWAYLALILGGVGALGWLFAQCTERHTHRVRAAVRTLVG
jgi:peptidoglycan/LPS O-acetylase OafA/YrhL